MTSSLLASSCAILVPMPSMSMAGLDAKCSNSRSNCAGHIELTQRMSAWSSLLDTGSLHAGHSGGI